MSTPPKEGKLLYHLTAIDNIENIIKSGLLPRNELQKKNISFQDTANQEILQRRSDKNLGDFVPFHFFIKNPYDGAQLKGYADKHWVYIVVYRPRDKEKHNWHIIPKHPLSEASHTLDIESYDDGFDKIDWELVAKRDYHDQECKKACMCEALHYGAIPTSSFFKIVCKTDEDKQKIDIILKEFNQKCICEVNTTWF
ncbi:DarT ssDNA thymidine ADP-ribosyltransferase family protein [Campylobacter mucosalis]|uniref:DarT ssDNA thymidine ADP-ribosyltransferase family protein n=1 Tax=Campylobacter TaxID=194 RepID=UPI00146FCA3E|nr:DarT ssDNA thymidine ADP-ribosyltransferase family protein [Campylobacter mucosalis]